jgi:heme ABC exporter ATP-binding subunit CcmA
VNDQNTGGPHPPSARGRSGVSCRVPGCEAAVGECGNRAVDECGDRTAAVSVRDVVRHFGRFAALRGISADFAPGRLYVLLGENGAGKTTLLRVIAGLLAPSRGTVRVLGSENIRAVATRFGYMGHAPLLYDEMSALENLEYFAALYGIDDRDRCLQAIRTVGLDPTLARRVGQYSQGMRQRISLARAIVHGPELLFLDEPFSNVDVRSAKQMTTLLATMRDQGTTIFVVTHQAALMEPVADECIILDAGRLVAREIGIPPRLLTPYLAEESAALRRHPSPAGAPYLPQSADVGTAPTGGTGGPHPPAVGECGNETDSEVKP